MARRVLVVLAGSTRELRVQLKATRALINALLLSNSIRRDTIAVLVFPSERLKLEVSGSRIRNLREDEESSLGVLRYLLRAKAETIREPIRVRVCFKTSEAAEKAGGMEIPECSALKEGFGVVDDGIPESVQREFCDETVSMPLSSRIEELVIIGNMVVDSCEEAPGF